MFTLSQLKSLCLSVILSIVFTCNIFAGTTGKISGKIIDQNSKEPLIGANIIIVGTMMGAASDMDGNFFIINIPPGIYEVRASLIGYSNYTYQNVRVSVDQTTKLDFELVIEAYEISGVVVSAERPIVQKDLTSTEANISGAQISMLPLEDVGSIVNLQAGVVEGHFRGGRIGEVKYLIDGVSVNDAYSGQSSLSAEVNSIQELQVLTGTFNAEYGEALSGVVNQVTKIAGEKYEGNFSFYTGDYITTRDDVFYNIDKISPGDVYNVQGNLSGPVPGLGNLVKFFISGRYLYDEGSKYGQRIFNPSDSSNFSNNDHNLWYVGATGDGEAVPMNYEKRLTLQSKLAINVGEGKGIVLSGMYQDREYKDYNHQFKLNPDGDYNKYQQSYLMSASYTHVFSNAAFMDFLGSAFITNYEQYVYENPLDARYVNPERMRDVSGSSFYTGGTENWHFNHDTKSYTAKTDLTIQLNNIHQVKSGIEMQYHSLDYQDYQIVIDASTGYTPTLPQPGAFNYNKYVANPYQFAAYLQDKIELDYLVVNAGVRFDYFEPDGKVLIDPDNIAVLDDMHPPFPDSLFKEASAKYQFSPRIGISYPISDRGAIHLSYGHFFQIPPFEYLYRNPNFRVPLTGDFPENVGNTIGNTDLEPQQTVMYEIGLQQELTPTIGVTVTAYYKDIRNLLATEIHIKNEFRKFSKLINRDYGSVKGFTLSFEKRFQDAYGFTLDYTYQVARGNASDPNDAFNKAQASPPIEANKQLVPLDWDRTHSLNFTLTLGYSDDIIASFVGKLGSGLPYTPSVQAQRTGLENSDTRPAFFNIDMYVTKYFKLFDKNVSVYLKVYNLFDVANEIEVFSDTGRAGYTLELTRSQEQPRGYNTLEEYFTRPDYYSAPRQIILGASIDF